MDEVESNPNRSVNANEETMHSPANEEPDMEDEDIVHHTTYVNSFSIRDSENSVEEFAGERTQNIAIWLNDLEDVGRMAGWNNQQLFIMCRKKLVGTARNFQETLSGVTTFSKLKKELLSEFGVVVRPRDVHRELESRRIKSNEGILEFVYAMQQLARTISLDETRLCEYIADGVTTDPHVRAILYETQTVQKLKRKLLLMERATKKTSESGQRKPVDQSKQFDQDLRKSINKRIVKNDERIRRCFNCGMLGHLATHCTRRVEDSPKCFSCGELGHRSNQCQKNEVLTIGAENDAWFSMNNEKEQLEFKMKQQGEIIANRDKQIENLKSDLTGLEDKLKKELDLLSRSEKDRLAEKTKLIECMVKIQSLEEKLKDSQQKQRQLNDRVRVLSSENGRLERELHEAFDKLAKAKEANDDRGQQLVGVTKNFNLLKGTCNITEAQLSEMEIFLEKELKRNKKCAEQMEILRMRRTEKENGVLKTNVGGREVIVTPRSLENAEDDEDEEEEDEDDEGYDSDKESNEYGSEEDIVSEIASSHENTSEKYAPTEQKAPWPPP